MPTSANKSKARFRTIDYGALFREVEGPPKPVEVYRFKNRRFVERPGHNPFKGQTSEQSGDGEDS